MHLNLVMALRVNSRKVAVKGDSFAMNIFTKLLGLGFHKKPFFSLGEELVSKLQKGPLSKP